MEGICSEPLRAFYYIVRDNDGLNLVIDHKNGEKGNVGFYGISRMVPEFTLVWHWLCVAFLFGKLPELCIQKD